MAATKIQIVEMGPRDGLQNEKIILSLAQKLEFVHLLEAAGHRRIEIGALVNPEKVPQMGDSRELYQALKKIPGIRYSMLLANQKGFDIAMQIGVQEIAIVTAASNTFNQKNINTTIDESLQRFAAFVPTARKNKITVRGYVSTAFACPYEGLVPLKSVIKVTESLFKMGVEEVSIGDTIGVAVPNEVEKMIKALSKINRLKKFAMHFHDTRGTGLANVYAALQSGISIFDASSGGLGGCPFAPGASGNVATDDLLYMLKQMGYETGIDLQKQIKASLFIQAIMGRRLPSHLLQTN